MTNFKQTKPDNNIEIPINWEIKRMQEIAEVTRLAGYEYSEYWVESEKGDVLALKGENIGKNELILKNLAYISNELSLKLKRSKLYQNDIVFPCVGTIGNSYVVLENDKFHINQNIAKISPRQEVINSFFLAQYLMSDLCKIEIRKFNATTSQPNVLVGSLRNFRINIPPLPEQLAIAHVLGSIDTAINANNQLITQKELRKKWLMQQLLSGKRRLKGFEGAWKEMQIRDVAKEVSIRNKSDKQLTVLSCTKYDGLVPSLIYFGRKIFADDVSTYKIVPKNHFAYATNHIEEGSIGYQDILGEALISPMYTVFQTDKTVNDDFFYRLLKSHPLVYQYQNRMEGSIDRRGGLRWDGFSIIKIKLPSIDEQIAITQVLQKADDEISILKTKIERLKEYKKGMMQVLLTGKKRLKIN